jgi:hypothetical protein
MQRTQLVPVLIEIVPLEGGRAESLDDQQPQDTGQGRRGPLQPLHDSFAKVRVRAVGIGLPGVQAIIAASALPCA